MVIFHDSLLLKKCLIRLNYFGLIEIYINFKLTNMRYIVFIHLFHDTNRVGITTSLNSLVNFSSEHKASVISFVSILIALYFKS